MPQGPESFDVAVVGASLAGCAAAALFARRGLSVALVDRDPDPAAYKRTCTHFIQASAIPTLERLGVVEEIERAGGRRNSIDVWTRYGWVRPPEARPDTAPRGFNVRRELLDPILRRRAAETPGVKLLLGHTARGLLGDGERATGVELATRDGRRATVRARLVVAADGRDSRLARLADVPPRTRPNRRFAYFAYYTGIDLASGPRSQMWMLDPDVAYAFPNDDGLTVLACFPSLDRLPAFRRDLEGSFTGLLAGLPDGPALGRAERVSPLLGRLDLTNRARPAAARGVAFIGDAALASDPLWGVGCGWALQSAELLADATAPALLDGRSLGRALGAYRRRHLAGPAAHHVFLCDFAAGRPLGALDRLFFAAGARDAPTAAHIEAYGERRIAPWKFVHPAALARAALHGGGVAAFATERSRETSERPTTTRARGDVHDDHETVHS